MRWLFPLGAIGSVVARLCCAGILTPLLISLLVAVGLGALVGNFDLIVFPALLIFLTLAFVGVRGRKACSPRPEGAPE